MARSAAKANPLEEVLALPKNNKKAQAPNAPALEVPDGGRLMFVRPSEIDLFSGNSRLVQNPNYDALRASIIEVGLKHPPVVATNPKTKRLEVYGGGNTRVQIYQELAESPEHAERFERMSVVVVPWKSDSDAGITHLIESDLHQPYTFIEQAHAIMHVRKALQEERGDKEDLTDKELVEHLAQAGYRVKGLTNCQISRMRSAIELNNFLPRTLSAGFKSYQVAALGKVLRSCVAAVEESGKHSAQAAEKKLLAALAKHDSETLKPNEMVNILQEETSQITGAPLPSKESQKEKETNEAKEKANEAEAAAAKLKEELTNPKRLRERCANSAATLAMELRMPELIQEVDTGCGYIVLDFPKLGSSRTAKAYVWWRLLEFSMLLTAPAAKKKEFSENSSPEFKALVLRGDFEAAFALASPVAIGEEAKLLPTLSEPAFISLMALMDAQCRLARLEGNLWR